MFNKEKEAVGIKLNKEKEAVEIKSNSKMRNFLINFTILLCSFLMVICLLMTYKTLSGYRQHRNQDTNFSSRTFIQQFFFSENEQENNHNSNLGATSMSSPGSFINILRDLRKNYALLKQQLKEKNDVKQSCPNLWDLQKQLKVEEDPEVNMFTCEIVNRWGYPCETHYATTKDGYILGIHRIPNSPKNNSTSKSYPVFLQHGLVANSADWIDNMPDISLGYLLADHGYDVWMGNFRGNTYSRNHTSLDPNSRIFWRWSWDEMAHQDLPAMLHYVLNNTNSDDLYYVGHSQGTMTAFAEFSQNQELAHKVRMFFALAPVTTVGHMTDILFNTLAPFANYIRTLLYDTSFSGEFLPRGTTLIDFLNKHVCIHPFTEFLCEDILWVVAGINCDQLNVTRLPVYISQTPAGTSLENLVHFAQMVRSKKYQMYNFGSDEANMQHYNQTTPPLYNVSTMTTPISIYHGGKDWLADREDVHELLEKLHHVDHLKFIEEYDHLDFQWATNAPDKIYFEMMEMMDKKLTEHSVK